MTARSGSAAHALTYWAIRPGAIVAAGLYQRGRSHLFVQTTTATSWRGYARPSDHQPNGYAPEWPNQLSDRPTFPTSKPSPYHAPGSVATSSCRVCGRTIWRATARPTPGGPARRGG